MNFTSFALILSIALAGAAEPAATLSLVVAGKPVASSALPAGWSTTATGDKLVIMPVQKRPHIQVWPVAATTVADAEKTISALIVSEVKEFAPNKREDLTVAGKAARFLAGPGVEADDGDPGNAEVTIFAVGTKVFVLVSHGEGTGPTERHGDLATVLATLKAN